jgi:hypothetical protein
MKLTAYRVENNLQVWDWEYKELENLEEYRNVYVSVRSRKENAVHEC